MKTKRNINSYARTLADSFFAAGSHPPLWLRAAAVMANVIRLKALPPKLPQARFELRPAYDKLVDVMLCLLHEAQRLDMDVTTYELVKAVFFADRSHLNHYGRPITCDLYLAMLNGPVGHAFYNMILEDPTILKHTGPVRWKRRVSNKPRPARYADRGPVYEYYGPERDVDFVDTLSESDVEELEEALREVKRLGISGVWRKTHKDVAWRAAWNALGDQKSYRMDLRLFFDDPNAENLREFALFASSQR